MLLGRNGTGKTTAIRAPMGLMPARGGSATLDGEKPAMLPPYRVAQRGTGRTP